MSGGSRSSRDRPAGREAAANPQDVGSTPTEPTLPRPCDYSVVNKPRVTLGPGYVGFYDPGHPLANKDGLVYEHRHVASVMLGRWVRPDEDVHHKDKNRANNTPSNLDVMCGSEHRSKEVLDYCRAVGLCIRDHTRRPCKLCKRETENRVYCSLECEHKALRHVERPPLEQVWKLVRESSFSAVGRMFGVTDNAIRKWLKIKK